MGQAGDKSEHMSIFISVGSAGDRVLSNHIQCRLKKQKKSTPNQMSEGRVQSVSGHIATSALRCLWVIFFFFVCSSVFVVLDGICSGTSRAGTVPEDLAPSLVYVIVM